MNFRELRRESVNQRPDVKAEARVPRLPKRWIYNGGRTSVSSTEENNCKKVTPGATINATLTLEFEPRMTRWPESSFKIRSFFSTFKTKTWPRFPKIRGLVFLSFRRHLLRFRTCHLCLLKFFSHSMYNISSPVIFNRLRNYLAVWFTSNHCASYSSRDNISALYLSPQWRRAITISRRSRTRRLEKQSNRRTVGKILL